MSAPRRWNAMQMLFRQGSCSASDATLIGPLSSPTPKGPLVSRRSQVPSSPFDDRSLQVKAVPLCLHAFVPPDRNR